MSAIPIMGAFIARIADSCKEGSYGKEMINSEVIVATISGYTSKQYANNHRDTHRNKSDSERNPRALKHPCKNITAQVISAEQVNTQWVGAARGIKGHFEEQRGEGGVFPAAAPLQGQRQGLNLK